MKYIVPDATMVWPEPKTSNNVIFLSNCREKNLRIPWCGSRLYNSTHNALEAGEKDGKAWPISWSIPTLWVLQPQPKNPEMRNLKVLPVQEELLPAAQLPLRPLPNNWYKIAAWAKNLTRFFPPKIWQDFSLVKNDFCPPLTRKLLKTTQYTLFVSCFCISS